MLKVRAHTCYLGKSGYSAHARSFFRELSKFIDLRVRNYTWDDELSYLNHVDTSIIDTITLTNSDGTKGDFPISLVLPQFDWVHQDQLGFQPDIDIVLMDMYHHYFYEEYEAKVKIAYTVWESTRLPDDFFNQLLKFDQLWVVSKWHHDIAIAQGFPKDRVKIVHEGVDWSLKSNINLNQFDKFTFMFFGRWDYRKSVPEIIKSWISAFPNREDVELIISADNPYSIDGLNSTEERLEHYNLIDPRIKVKHFLTRPEYEEYLSKGHVFISCARSEGWNIPLIEAMASGTPSIYSDWGAQLEFAKGKGLPVKIAKERLANLGADLGFAGATPGNYCEPDFNNLSNVLIDCFENWETLKKKALIDANIIWKKFNWNRVAQEAMIELNKSLNMTPKKEIAIIMSHADTDIKLEILEESVLALKAQGLEVLISSHIDISPDINELADYVVIDKQNPIIYPEEYSKYSSTTPVHWISYPGFKLTYPFEFNHGYAALRLIMSGLGVAKAHGYTIAHFINYDYSISDPEVFKQHTHLLETSDLVSYSWGGIKDSMNTGLFSANVTMLMAAVSPITSKRRYFSWENKVILEDVLYSACESYGLDIVLLDIETIKNEENRINQVVLPTYPNVDTKVQSDAYCYLAEFENKKYLCLIGSEKVEVIADIYSQSDSLSLTVIPSGIMAIPISNNKLVDGIKINFPKLGVTYNYTIDSRLAELHELSETHIYKVTELYELNSKFTYAISYLNGPKVEIFGETDQQFKIEFINNRDNSILYSTQIEANCWTACTIKYFIDWKIRITNLGTLEVIEEDFNINDKKVLISIESSALGDSIAWFQYIEEFKKVNGCKVVVSTFKNNLFKSNYPDLEFIEPGEGVDGIEVYYHIGWFYGDGDQVNFEMHPYDFKNQPLQKTASDILGLDWKQLRPQITAYQDEVVKKYVCIGLNSTCQAKYWNNIEGWQKLTNWFISRGFGVIATGSEPDGYMDNWGPTGMIPMAGLLTLEQTADLIKNCEYFIGLGSGLSWLAWALEVPTVLISGFSLPYTEMEDDWVIRIFKSGICTGCFNKTRLDASDWNWCPSHKGTRRQFECTTQITANQVIDEIIKYEEIGQSTKSIEIIVQESYDLGMVQNHHEIMEAAKFFSKLNVNNFMEIGTDQGGSFAIWSKLSSDGIRVSLDLPHGEFGRADYNEYERDVYLKSLGSNVNMFWGSSHDEKWLDIILKCLDGKKLDFLFIDGDHTYEGVKMDFLRYRELVKEGGWIGFHDIKDTPFHRSANCRVDQLWNELEGEKIEFLDNSSQYGGIGFIKV